MPVIRTPEARFADLPDYPFAPRYLEVDGLRLHYVDEGPRDGPAVLLMHGMPTWSFLNRHIIKRLTAAGWRCIAADHFGFGRSDKPVDDAWYTFTRHRDSLQALAELTVAYMLSEPVARRDRKSMGSLEGFTEQLKPGDMGVATTTLPDPVQFLEADGTVSPEIGVQP